MKENHCHDRQSTETINFGAVVHGRSIGGEEPLWHTHQDAKGPR
jgi:hypothetical protein